MTKSTITREQQRQILIDTAQHIISRDNTSPYSENLREIARIALAAMDSDPVAWRWRSGPDTRWHLASSGDLAGEVEPLYRHDQPELVVQCPFPCGWDNLNKLAIQDAVFVACGLVEGGMVTESHRQAVISNNDRLLKVIAANRAAMLNGGKS